MELTRLLYAKDEVKYMCNMIFILGDKYEAIWWYYEYYESNSREECFIILYRAYYDFYAHKNPNIYKLIETNWKLWKCENNFNYIAQIIHNLYMCECTREVFDLRNANNSPPIYFRGRKPQWLHDNFPERHHQLIMSLHNNKLSNLVHYASNEHEVFKYVITYYKLIHNVSIKENDEEYFNHVKNHEVYNDTYHYILALITHLKETTTNININSIYDEVTDDVNLFINNIQNIYNNSKKRYLLLNCRQYHIRNEINMFNLNRHKFKCRNELRDYVTYNSDVELEFDEQPVSVQDASIGNLSKNMDIELIDNFKKIYL
jgi:hypothetical protein